MCLDVVRLHGDGKAECQFGFFQACLALQGTTQPVQRIGILLTQGQSVFVCCFGIRKTADRKQQVAESAVSLGAIVGQCRVDEFLCKRQGFVKAACFAQQKQAVRAGGSGLRNRHGRRSRCQRARIGPEGGRIVRRRVDTRQPDAASRSVRVILREARPPQTVEQRHALPAIRAIDGLAAGARCAVRPKHRR